MRIGAKTSACRRRFADLYYRAPFAEARAQFGIFGETFAEAVQTFRDLLATRIGQRLRPFIHFNARNDSLLTEKFGEGNAVIGFLADRLVEKNDSAYELS